MRSIQDLLRDYNFVNTTEGRRNTVRFFAGFLALAAGGFMVFFVAFGGGDTADDTYQTGAESEDPFKVTATQTAPGEWYIGYSTDHYDPDERHRYSEHEIQEKLDQWETDYGAMIRDIETVRSDDGNDVLLGYKVRLTQPLSIGVLNR